MGRTGIRPRRQSVRGRRRRAGPALGRSHRGVPGQPAPCPASSEPSRSPTAPTAPAWSSPPPTAGPGPRRRASTSGTIARVRSPDGTSHSRSGRSTSRTRPTNAPAPSGRKQARRETPGSQRRSPRGHPAATDGRGSTGAAATEKDGPDEARSSPAAGPDRGRGSACSGGCPSRALRGTRRGVRGSCARLAIAGRSGRSRVPAVRDHRQPVPPRAVVDPRHDRRERDHPQPHVRRHGGTARGARDWRGSWTALVPVAAFVLVIDRTQVPAEEAALVASFGASYDAYRAAVPRWLDARSLRGLGSRRGTRAPSAAGRA